MDKFGKGLGTEIMSKNFLIYLIPRARFIKPGIKCVRLRQYWAIMPARRALMSPGRSTLRPFRHHETDQMSPRRGFYEQTRSHVVVEINFLDPSSQSDSPRFFSRPNRSALLFFGLLSFLSGVSYKRKSWEWLIRTGMTIMGEITTNRTSPKHWLLKTCIFVRLVCELWKWTFFLVAKWRPMLVGTFFFFFVSNFLLFAVKLLSKMYRR